MDFVEDSRTVSWGSDIFLVKKKKVCDLGLNTVKIPMSVYDTTGAGRSNASFECRYLEVHTGTVCIIVLRSGLYSYIQSLETIAVQDD